MDEPYQAAPASFERKFMSWLKMKIDVIVVKGNLTPAQSTSLDSLLEELYRQGTPEEQALVQDITTKLPF